MDIQMARVKQSGVTFDSSLMNDVRTIKAELQIRYPDEKITMTQVMEYLIDLYKRERMHDAGPKEMKIV